jgi:hypothetical protein
METSKRIWSIDRRCISAGCAPLRLVLALHCLSFDLPAGLLWVSWINVSNAQQPRVRFVTRVSFSISFVFSKYLFVFFVYCVFSLFNLFISMLHFI